jgi:hypothetical protein
MMNPKLHFLELMKKKKKMEIKNLSMMIQIRDLILFYKIIKKKTLIKRNINIIKILKMILKVTLKTIIMIIKRNSALI